jgi:hypothetical protein
LFVSLVTTMLLSLLQPRDFYHRTCAQLALDSASLGATLVVFSAANVDCESFSALFAALMLASRSALNACARLLKSCITAAISCRVTRACWIWGAKHPPLTSFAVSSASLVSNGVDRPLVAMAATDDKADAVVVVASYILDLESLAFAASPRAVQLAAAATLLHIHLGTAKASLPISVSASLYTGAVLLHVHLSAMTGGTTNAVTVVTISK